MSYQYMFSWEDHGGNETEHTVTYTMSRYLPQSRTEPEEPSEPEIISIDPPLPDGSEPPDYLLAEMASAAFDQDCCAAEDAADLRWEMRRDNY